ncbi:fused MFS/spermidine synthase [Myroides sp. JBRI-B21084]|uniref:spermidine synthase n=1 Tax=Myroides sp. JBRI-B21084 TaxID=3119977 RepID=UPI0026E26A80|nr:fused MFS/spermidine synthase [Paenimyroides cloacae]WKW46766.1 fused MFS/spermidine synthase [Paenimyroides cloacae]
MNILKKYLSYLNIIPEKKYQSVHNGVLEINWVNGSKVLDTQNTNYSYGNLGKVLQKGLVQTKSNFTSKASTILVLGLGGGDVIKQLQQQFKTEGLITAVEIDPIVIQIAMNDFGIIPDKSLEIINNDALQFIKYTKKTFDLIIVDLFTDSEIPEFVFNNSFIMQIHNILKINGTAILNTFILNDEHELRNQKLIDLLQKNFAVQSFKNLYGHNHLIVIQKTA